MKKKDLIIGLVLGAIIGFIMSGFAPLSFLQKDHSNPQHRFEIREIQFKVSNAPLMRAVKMDTTTGESWGLCTNGWIPIPQPN